MPLAMLLALPPAGAQTTVDYDADDDGLIEIANPAQLNAIRHDLDGDGLQGSVTVPAWANYIAAGAFPSPASGQCPGGCQGYELTADIDLSGYANWNPIGGTFNTTFDGNGHSISGLTATVTGSHAGLFHQLGGSGVVRKVGVINPAIRVTSSDDAGALVGRGDSGSSIHSSYVSGGSITLTVTAENGNGGGLAGYTRGTVRASYSTARVVLEGSPQGVYLGGLVGWLRGGQITASYAAGAVTGSSAGSGTYIGGLVGSSTHSSAAITDSYCNNAATTQNACVRADQLSASTKNDAAQGKTARELRRPTQYAGTIYANWNLDLSDPADGMGDDPWDFGTHRNYPLLKIDKNGDGRATCEEFSGQPCYRAPGPPPYNPAHDHPEIYTNPRYEMAASCAVQTTGTGDDAISTSTLTFDLGDYTRPLTLALSLWDGDVFRSLQSQDINMPELRQTGQTATVEVVTDPAQTRFRIDSEYGLNLVLGYADCHTDDP